MRGGEIPTEGLFPYASCEARRSDSDAPVPDPEGRLFKKPTVHQARMAFAGHVPTENRNGPVVGPALTPATGIAFIRANPIRP